MITILLLLLFNRLVMEEDRMALYFSAQNSRVYHKKELMGIDISENVRFSGIIIILYY